MATHINYFNTLNSNKINSLKSIFVECKIASNLKAFFKKNFCVYAYNVFEIINNKNYFMNLSKTLKSNSIKIMNKSGKYGEI